MTLAPEVLAALNSITPQDAKLNIADPAIRLIHRKLKDAEVYLFFNESAVPTSHTIAFKTKPHTIKVWDPETGNVSSAETPSLQQKPYETRVFVVH